MVFLVIVARALIFCWAGNLSVKASMRSPVQGNAILLKATQNDERILPFLFPLAVDIRPILKLRGMEVAFEVYELLLEAPEHPQLRGCR